MSAYGNIPDDDVRVVGKAAGIAAEVVQNLPSGAPHGWFTVAYELVLQATLADWVQHSTDDLDSDDAEDLSNIVRASADIALAQEPSLQDPAFRVTLRGWLDDWVTNWGAEE